MDDRAVADPALSVILMGARPVGGQCYDGLQQIDCSRVTSIRSIEP